MYVVLASTATMTIVCIGWRHARRESVWRRGVTFLFTQTGVAGASAVVAPRALVGTKNVPSNERTIFC